MIDAIIVIVQYARDQAGTVSSYRITILRLPDNYNQRTGPHYKLVWAGLVFMHA